MEIALCTIALLLLSLASKSTSTRSKKNKETLWIPVRDIHKNLSSCKKGVTTLFREVARSPHVGFRKKHKVIDRTKGGTK